MRPLCGIMHSQDGRDAIVAANLSANALAELAAHAEKAHVPAGDPTCTGMADPTMSQPNVAANLSANALAELAAAAEQIDAGLNS